MKGISILKLDDLALQIRANLTPDLLKPAWRHANAQGHAMTGHCYVASEAYYHARGRGAGFKPRVLRIGGTTHWWLQNDQGEIVDLTAEQFEDGVPYEQGKGIGFLTSQPSKRAQALLDKIQATKEATPPATRARPRPRVA